MAASKKRSTSLALACGLLLFATPAAADELRAEAAFEHDWAVQLWMGAPAGVGYAVERSVGDSWQVRGSVGVPMFMTGIGGSVDVVHGARVGPVSLWLGASAVGYASDQCSWGGCGDYVSYWGAGPLAGVQLTTGFVGHTRLVADLGAGVALALERTSNLARYQPLGGLRLGVGW